MKQINFRIKVKALFNKASAPALTEVQGHPVHIVDPDNPRSVKLLSQAYEDVYKPAFPLEEEREALEVWIKKRKGRHCVVAIAGNNLGAKRAVIKGVSVAYYYIKEDVGLLAYNAIAPEFRNEGLGRVMVEARKQALLEAARKKGKSLKGVFIECNDPAKIKPEEDSMDPAVRLQIFQKWGAKVMPIDYVQPPLTKELAKCDKMKLLAYPHPETGEYPAPEGIKGFINGIYNALAKRNGSVPKKDPDYIRIVTQIEALKR